MSNKRKTEPEITREEARALKRAKLVDTPWTGLKPINRTLDAALLRERGYEERHLTRVLELEPIGLKITELDRHIEKEGGWNARGNAKCWEIEVCGLDVDGTARHQWFNFPKVLEYLERHGLVLDRDRVVPKDPYTHISKYSEYKRKPKTGEQFLSLDPPKFTFKGAEKHYFWDYVQAYYSRLALAAVKDMFNEEVHSDRKTKKQQALWNWPHLTMGKYFDKQGVGDKDARPGIMTLYRAAASFHGLSIIKKFYRIYLATRLREGQKRDGPIGQRNKKLHQTLRTILSNSLQTIDPKLGNTFYSFFVSVNK